jgi:predicted metal-dependent hydrolase
LGEVALVLDEWDQFLRGIELFNRAEFYDCHDTIEEIWLQESSDEQHRDHPQPPQPEG